MYAEDTAEATPDVAPLQHDAPAPAASKNTMSDLLSPPTTEQRHAYVLLRLLTALNFFGHGFARIFTGSHLGGFAQGMAKGFAATPLPYSLALATGYVVPCIELLTGTLLLLGLFTQQALTLALCLMLVLMFGVTLKQDWAVAGDQLIYGLVLALLLFARERYDCSWPEIMAARL